MVNRVVIANRSADAAVEVPSYVDGNGISVLPAGDVPSACAAINSQNINVQCLAVDAAMTGNGDMLKQVILLDPPVGAVCNSPEGWTLTAEMIEMEKERLPRYKAVQPKSAKQEGGI